MAAPVVAGVAALVLEYFPDLSAEQLKYVIDNSVEPMTEKVQKPGTGDMVNLSDLCISGGEVNAYNAVKLAATLKGDRNKVSNNSQEIKKIEKKERHKRRA